MSTTQLRILCFVLIGSILTGCAVLTVDVDVYKGVLSNEQSTQVNQLQALVPASRNLMVQMFNDLRINRDLDQPVRLRLDETEGVVFEGYNCKTKEWSKISAEIFRNGYPANLGGDKLAQQRIAFRLAYIVGLFDDITTTSSSAYKAAQLTAGDRSSENPNKSKGINTLASEAESATQNFTPSTTSQKAIADFRDSMSKVANQIVLLNQFGDFGSVGILHRIKRGLWSTGRNGGIPSTSDALMLLQALGNSILAITDELSHRESWEKATRLKAINDLAAIQKALYGDESIVQKLWQAQSKIQVQNKEAELKKAQEAATAAQNRLASLPAKADFDDVKSKVEGMPLPPNDTAVGLKEILTTLKVPKLSEDKINFLFECSKASTEGNKTLAQWKIEFSAVATNYGTVKESLEKEKDATEGSAQRAETANLKAANFDELLTEFLKEQPPPKNTVEELYQALKSNFAGKGYESEIKGLRLLTPVLDLPPLPDLKVTDLTQSQVTDAAVTSLRAYRLHLLLTPYLPSDTAAKDLRIASINQVEEALKQLEATRSESIPLRPAGAILRTATPVTAFQSNAPTSSGNMLTRFLTDTVPIVGPIAKKIGTTFSHPDYNPELELRLDREFWQPINHIELQGTGKTNYAVIKDDIGNWYVKSYSADPKDAMKAFSHLLSAYYAPTKGLVASAATALKDEGKASTGTTAPSETLKTAVQEKEETQNKAFIESVDKLKGSVAALSKGALDGVTNPKAEVLTQQLAAIDKDYGGKPKERSQALIALGKDYGLQRLAAAAQSKSAALVNQNAKADLLDRSTKLAASADSASKASLDKETKEATDAKDKADKQATAAETELKTAIEQLDAFKTAAKTFFKERSDQLDQQDAFLREKLLATITP
jgi:hypothetical protein